MSTKPRVLHLISELDVGGSERSLQKLLPYLEPYFENHVACEMGRGTIGRELENQGVPVHYLDIPSRFTPLAVSRVVTLIRNLEADCVIGTLVHADLVGRLAARLMNRPFISNQRSSLHHQGYLRYLDFATQNLVKRYVVQTEYAKAAMHRRGHVPEQKIATIPNVVELPRLTSSRTAVRAHHNLMDNDVIITCVSNLRPGKGHDCLLRALPHVSSLKLLLVGAGPLRQNLEQQAKKLGLTAAVTFLGTRQDVSDILASSDLFVLPSEAEGMSNALLEAMAAGLPCLASNIPANRALITEGKNGQLFRVNDHQHLAQKMAALLSNVTERQRLGQAAALYVQQHHSPAIVVQQWRQLLQKTIPL